ncbi:MAG: hypothetical protein O2984_02345 [Bacteroidetes bacterium]|nr:hypothetical protein [Bacteroidota bacterium]
MNRSLIFLLSTLLFLSACKKESDEVLPTISYIIPSGNGNQYEFDDDINVRLNVGDDQALKLITVRIEHNSSNAILGVKSEALSGTSSEVLLIFPFDNIHLPGGTYTISATVEDEAGNNKSAFREIVIFEVPVERESIGIIQQNGNSLSIDTLSQNGNFINAWQGNGTYNSSLMGNYYQELLIGEGDLARVKFINTQTWQEESSFQIGSALANDQIRDIAFSETRRLYYVAFFDGIIRLYGENGNQSGSVDLPLNYRPIQMSLNGQTLLVHAEQIGSDNELLVQFNAITGIITQSSNIPGNLLKIVPYEDEFLLFSEDQGDLMLRSYNGSNGNTTTLPWLVSNQMVHDVIPIDNGFYAVAHADGVYLYQFGSGAFLSGTNNGVNARSLKFDPVGNVLYALDNSSLHQISPNSGQLIQSFAVPSGSRDFFIQLNK